MIGLDKIQYFGINNENNGGVLCKNLEQYKNVIKRINELGITKGLTINTFNNLINFPLGVVIENDRIKYTSMPHNKETINNLYKYSEFVKKTNI